MYGERGPPKGYSTPRYDTKASKRCQHCNSTAHWSFECPHKKKSGGGGGDATVAGGAASSSSSKPATRLSRTQMLKYGIKRRRVEFEPELTEREQYDAELRQLGRILMAEAKEAAANETRSTKAAPVSEPSTTMPLQEDPTEFAAPDGATMANTVAEPHDTARRARCKKEMRGHGMDNGGDNDA